MRLSLLVVAAFLAVSDIAHADTIDDFSITSSSVTILFSLPASFTEPIGAFDFASLGTGATTGTVNGAPSPITTSIVFPGPCVLCGTFDISTNAGAYDLFLPSLYTITYSAMTTGTFSFLPGSYTVGAEYPFYSGPYTINITPEATTVTPEPNSLVLLGTGLLGILGAARRRIA